MLEQPKYFISSQSKGSEHCHSLREFNVNTLIYTTQYTKTEPLVPKVQESQTIVDEVH